MKVTCPSSFFRTCLFSPKNESSPPLLPPPSANATRERGGYPALALPRRPFVQNRAPTTPPPSPVSIFLSNLFLFLPAELEISASFLSPRKIRKNAPTRVGRSPFFWKEALPPLPSLLPGRLKRTRTFYLLSPLRAKAQAPAPFFPLLFSPFAGDEVSFPFLPGTCDTYDVVALFFFFFLAQKESFFLSSFLGDR